MITIRKIRQKLHQVFREHYPYIGLTAVLTLLFVGFLDHELKYNNRDLIFWKGLLDFCFIELEHFILVLFVLVVLIKAIFLAFIVAMNTRRFHWLEELTQVETKKRYARFLLLRLFAEIDNIETRYLRHPRKVISMQALIMANKEMTLSIQTFRRDARKLLHPNEIDVSQPIEEVYSMSAKDERLVRQSRFFNMDITAEEDLIKSLISP